MRLPADNKFVDGEGRIVKPWRDVLQRLEPLLDSIDALLGTTEDDEATGAIGDIQYRDANGFANLPIGLHSGDVLSVNDTLTAPEWREITGRDLLATFDCTAGGTAFSLTDIPSDYFELYVELESVSFTGTVTLNLALSGDNGINYGTPVSVSASIGAAQAIHGHIRLGGLKITGSEGSCTGYYVVGGTGVTGSAFIFPVKHATGGTDPVNAIQLAGGTFDAGTIRVYGIR